MGNTQHILLLQWRIGPEYLLTEYDKKACAVEYAGNYVARRSGVNPSPSTIALIEL